MTTLTLYKDTELNNKYQDVFKTKALLESYLSDKVSATISGEFYFKMTGSFNLPVSGYADVPNYMKAVDSLSGNTTYYFINSYENYNGIFKISYIIDVWHTYVDVLKIGPGTRNRSSTILGSYADLPYYMQINERYRYNMNQIGSCSGNVYTPDSTYYIFATGYYYQGATSYSGIPSRATSFATVSETRSYGWDDDGNEIVFLSPSSYSYEKAMEEAPIMMQAFAAATHQFSVSGTNTFYIQITNIWLIPAKMSGKATTNVNIFDSLTPLTKPFDWNTETEDDLKYAIKDDGNVYWRVLHGGDIIENIVNESNYKSPFFKYADIPDDKKPYMGHYVIKSIGIGKEAMPIPMRLYKESQKIITTTVIGTNGIAVNLSINDMNVDLAQGWEISINFTPETAQTAQARQTNAIQGAIGTGTSMINGAVNTVSSGNPFTMATSIVSGIGTIAQMALDFMNPTKSTVSAGSSCIDPYEHIYWDCVAVGYYVENYEQVNQAYKLCGVEVCYPTSGDDLTDGTDYDYNVIGYSQVKINGAIPEQYKESFEAILMNGVRVWQKAYSHLNPLSDDIETPPDLVEI